MFDLEQSIAEWRRQMLAAGIKTPVPLEELESHLRDEIERHLRQGSNPAKAFEVAVEKLGPAGELKNEFRQTGETLDARFVTLAGVACVVVAFVFSLWILLALFVRPEMSWLGRMLGLMGVAALLLNWKFNYIFLPVIRNPMIRTIIGFACCVGCLFWIQFFIAQVVPSMIEPINGGGLTKSWSLSNDVSSAVFLWGWTTMAILGSIGFGLEKAARKSISFVGFLRKRMALKLLNCILGLIWLAFYGNFLLKMGVPTFAWLLDLKAAIGVLIFWGGTVGSVLLMCDSKWGRSIIRTNALIFVGTCSLAYATRFGTFSSSFDVWSFITLCIVSILLLHWPRRTESEVAI